MDTRELRRLSDRAFAALQRRVTRRQVARGAAAVGVAGAIGARATAATAAQGAAPTGTVVISLAGEPTTLEAWHAYSTIGLAPLRNIFESLINRDPVTNELVGELAESWEWQDDRTLHFRLRPNVTFHDGTPCDAAAAAVGLNWIWSKENNFQIIQFMGPQISAEAIDALTLRVSTAEPDPILPNRIYFSPLSSAKQIQEAPASMVDTAIGTGPYRVVDWARGERLTLTAYDGWWGTAATDARGAQAIKDVEFVWRDESAVRAAQVVAGEAQIGRFLTPEDCETTPVCARAASVEVPFLRLDTMHPVMADRRVREAIGLAVDKTELAAVLFGGADVATQMVGPSAAGFNPDLTALPYDLERAEQLVAEAAAAGVPVADPIVVAIRRGAYPRNDEMGEYVAAQLQLIGLNASAEIIEPAAYEEQFTIGYPNVSPERGWIGTNSHGNEMMDVGQTASGYYVCTGGVSTFCDQAIDAQVAAAGALTGDERAAAFREVTAAFLEHIPVVPLVNLPNYYGVAENLSWQPRLDGFMLVKEMTLAG